MRACCRPLKITPRQGLRLFLRQQVLLLFAGSALGLWPPPGCHCPQETGGRQCAFLPVLLDPHRLMLGPESNAFSVPFILSSALWVDSPSAILTAQGRELRLREICLLVQSAQLGTWGSLILTHIRLSLYLCVQTKGLAVGGTCKKKKKKKCFLGPVLCRCSPGIDILVGGSGTTCCELGGSLWPLRGPAG